jgi:hypothetical protein
MKAGPLLHHIAAHLAHDTPLLPEERELLDSIYPLEGTGWPYDAHDPGPLFNSKKCNHDAIAARLPDLTRVCWALLIRRPSVELAHFPASCALVWKIRWSPCECPPVWYVGTTWYRGDPEERDLPRKTWKFRPIAVTGPLPPLLAWAAKDDWAWLTWRPALYMYLLLFGVVVAAVRAAKWQYLVVAAPVVVQALVLALVGAPCFRYHWGVYLAGMLCSGFLLLGVPLRRVACKE